MEIKQQSQYIETFSKEVVITEKIDVVRTLEAVAKIYLTFTIFQVNFLKPGSILRKLWKNQILFGYLITSEIDYDTIKYRYYL